MTGYATFLGQTADGQVKHWLANHPDAFYLNAKGKQNWMLHKADCWHLGDGEGANAATNPKVCAEQISELEEWARSTGGKITDCSSCRPR